MSQLFSRKSTAFGITSMLAVGLVSVTTSTPAVAAESGVVAPMETVSSVSPLAQTIEVTGSVAASEIQRDGFTVNAPAPVEAAPAPVEEAPVVEEAPAPEPAPAPVVTWSLPSTGSITSSFGPRPNKPVAGVNPFHKGTDIASASGTPIHAAFGGTVVQAGVNGTYGNWVLIEHGNGIQTGYAHLSVINVNIGQTVASGDVIAAMGSTGASTGPHLHFEVRVNGEPIDSVPFMSERGVAIG